MHIERERRFEVVGTEWRTTAHSPVQMTQGWLHTGGGVQVRVRVGETWGSVACKIDLDGSSDRIELEASVPHAVATALMTRCSRQLHKTRWIVDHDDVRFEIDVYEGALDGVVTAEVEDPPAVLALPSWIAREVTGVAGWSNAALARDGAPRS